MALDCSLGSMGILNDLFDGACEQAVECDITLPDYCPDIARVLKCTVTPAVVSSKISGDRACADGSVCVRLVYCGEDSGIYSYEHECPFSKYAELGGEKNGSLITDIKTEYVNCRAISGRRAEVRAMLHISFKITALSQRSIITSVERQGVQTQKCALDISDIVACECKQFTVNETVELPADYLPADRIVSVCAVPILNDTKIVKDKILIKGEAAVTVIYFSNGLGCETSKYCYSLLISQIVDMPGIRSLPLVGHERGLAKVFPEIADAARSCRFRDCTHTHEPGCAVREALAEGAFCQERYDAYVALAQEMRRSAETLDPDIVL